jgi:YHYH protein
MKLAFGIVITSFVIASAILISCNKDDTTTTEDTSGTVPTVISSNYKPTVTLSASATTVTLKSNGTPDHVSPYWGSGNTLYEAPSLAGQVVNPGNLMSQVFVMTIPINPVEATSKEATSLGPIGMALNGVAIYNDREGGNVPVDAGTLLSFDRGGAHSGPGGLYHYHFNGDFTSVNDAKLIGWLRDGFPIYGRKDTTGIVPTNLDANGGHVGPTQNYPSGIYHYHCSNTAYMGSRFYVLKAGSYHGTKGTFTF